MFGRLMNNGMNKQAHVAFEIFDLKRGVIPQLMCLWCETIGYTIWPWCSYSRWFSHLTEGREKAVLVTALSCQDCGAQHCCLDFITRSP